MLLELDADLARQQEAIGGRRERLAALLAETDLHPDSTVSPEMAEVLRGLPTGGSKFAEFDRELLTLLGGAADPADRSEPADLLRPLTEPGAVARGHALYARLDELADAGAGDPRIAAVAADLAADVHDAGVPVRDGRGAGRRRDPAAAFGAPVGLRAVVLVVDGYTVLIVLAVIAASITRPHVVTADEVRIRYGAFLDLRVPRARIAEIRHVRNFNENGMVKAEDGRLVVAVASQTNLIIELTEPITAVRPLGRRFEARTIRLFADDPGAAFNALRTHPEHVPGS